MLVRFYSRQTFLQFLLLKANCRKTRWARNTNASFRSSPVGDHRSRDAKANWGREKAPIAAIPTGSLSFSAGKQATTLGTANIDRGTLGKNVSFAPRVWWARRRPSRSSVLGFTLIELLVVIVIIGIIAAIGLPALKGLGSSNVIDAAKRQILDDLALARLTAINNRTTVLMLFVPPLVLETNLIPFQYNSYALFSKRAVGAQPGQENPRYFTEWRQLPEGTFFATNKFGPLVKHTNEYLRAFLPTNNIPIFRRNYTNYANFRYVAFNSYGQLNSGRDELIPIAQGSIFYQKHADGSYATNSLPDVIETPPFNHTNNYIRVNWLTGRAHLEKRVIP